MYSTMDTAASNRNNTSSYDDADKHKYNYKSKNSSNCKSCCIQVICAGLGRTGTLSLTEALTILGYQPYHYVDLAHTAQWAALARGEIDSNQIIELIVKDGYDAVLENPTCDIYQEILARYPDAKVILTVRDSPQDFVQSWKVLMDTMLVTEQGFQWSFPSFFQWIPLFRHLKQLRQFMGTTHLGLQPGELTHGWRHKQQQCDEWLAQQYERHNQHVIDHTLPHQQLLVFNVKEGWEPLCKFLGCPTPPANVQFPHSKVNDKAALLKLKKMFLIAVYSWIPVVVSAVVGVGAWYRTKCQRASSASRSSK